MPNFVDAQTVAPNDAADLPGGVCRALVIGAGGALKFTNALGKTSTVTLPACKINLAVKRVWATGTTATTITALYGADGA